MTEKALWSNFSSENFAESFCCQDICDALADEAVAVGFESWQWESTRTAVERVMAVLPMTSILRAFSKILSSYRIF